MNRFLASTLIKHITLMKTTDEEHVCNLGDFILAFEDVIVEDPGQVFSSNKDPMARHVFDLLIRTSDI